MLERISFVSSLGAGLAAKRSACRSPLCRRPARRNVPFTCMANFPRSQSAPRTSLSQSESLQTEKAEDFVDVFLKQLRDTHTALQGRNPPAADSIEQWLRCFKDRCLEVQANLDRTLPGMSHLDRTISATRGETAKPRELARLLQPTGPLRTLCGALITARSQAHDLFIESSPSVDIPVPLRAARGVVARYASFRPRGPAVLRNAAWRSLPWEAMRAHPSVIELPEPAGLHISSVRHLSKLQQNSEAFTRSRKMFPLRADTVWRVLGLGEEDAIERFGDAIPSVCRGHRHALEAWQAFFDDGSACDAGFDEAYQIAHIPNAVLSYLAAAKEDFDEVFRGRASWASPVRMREAGLFVRELENAETVMANPLGTILRRRKEDFWAWASNEDMILLAKSEMVFSADGPGWEFGVEKPRERVGIISFLEAQLSMLVCGEQYRIADVIWHGVVSGTKTFRVERDDELLHLVERGIESFCRRFVWDSAQPPEKGFHVGKEFDELEKRMKEEYGKVRMVYEVGADVDEMRIEGYRETMSDWERRKLEMPFLRAKKGRE